MHALSWFRAAEPLAPRTTLGVGGAARWFADCTDEARLVAALRWATSHSVPVHIMGGGSNTLVADAGFDGLVLAPSLRGISHQVLGDRVEVTAAAGEPWDAFVAHTVAQRWAGLACLSGIPGHVGAAPIQNIGAYGQEVADCLLRVRVWDRVKGQVLERGAEACGFGYRTSRFKRDPTHRDVVLAATFTLIPGGTPTLRYAELARQLGDAAVDLAQVREAVLALRRGKSMVYDVTDANHRSAGSFFMNPQVAAEAWPEVLARITAAGLTPPHWPQPDGRIKLSAAWLIERAGLPKGSGVGRVGLSSRHTLALINRGGATALELLGFAAHVRATVGAAFGVWLMPEPVLLGVAEPAAGLLDRLAAAQTSPLAG
jgi:UDP-N-acetylmuramate dehydrogenase